jgi:hypothetical protein
MNEVSLNSSFYFHVKTTSASFLEVVFLLLLIRSSNVATLPLGFKVLLDGPIPSTHQVLGWPRGTIGVFYLFGQAG